MNTSASLLHTHTRKLSPGAGDPGLHASATIHHKKDDDRGVYCVYNCGLVLPGRRILRLRSFW